MRQHGAGKPQLMPQIRIQPGGRRGIIRPDNEQGLANHVGLRHRPPFAAIAGVVAVVAHDKELTGRNHASTHLLGPASLPAASESITFGHLAAIYEKGATPHLDLVAANGYHSLEEDLARIARIVKGHNVAASH